MASNGAPSEDFDKLPVRRVVKRPVPRQVVDFDDLESRAKQKPQPWQPTRRQFLGVCGAVAGSIAATALGIGFMINPDLFGHRYLTLGEYLEIMKKDRCHLLGKYGAGDTLYIRDRVFTINTSRVTTIEETYYVAFIRCESSKHDLGVGIRSYNNETNYRAALELQTGDEFIFTSPIIEDSGCITANFTDGDKNTIRKVT